MQSVGLISNVATGLWSGFFFNLGLLAVNVSILVWKENKTLRWVAYLVQWIFFVLLCIGLLIWLLAIDVFGLVKLVCNG